MTTALIGKTIQRPTNERVPINIDSQTRENLRALLYQPWMRGVGWSEFINRAVARAYEEHEEHCLPDQAISTDIRHAEGLHVESTYEKFTNTVSAYAETRRKEGGRMKDMIEIHITFDGPQPDKIVTEYADECVRLIRANYLKPLRSITVYIADIRGDDDAVPESE